MRVLDIERSLDAPANFAMKLVVRIKGRASIGAIHGERWWRRNSEGCIKNRQIVLNGRTAECVHNQDRLAASIQVGGEIVCLANEPGRVADQRDIVRERAAEWQRC